MTQIKRKMKVVKLRKKFQRLNVNIILIVTIGRQARSMRTEHMMNPEETWRLIRRYSANEVNEI